MAKENYYVVKFSGGKDSSAMLLHLLELKEPINEVVFCDTYKEFPQMYEHIEKIKKIVEEKNIKFTILKNEKSFDFWMFEHEVKHRNPEDFRSKFGDVKGYSWATARERWCTGTMKIKITDKYFRGLSKQFNLIYYIGLAADEEKRLQRKFNQQPNHKHPLVEWGWTEADCLSYCYSLGYDWGGLYEIFDRVSCWCCPLQPLSDLRQLRKNCPELWEELKEMDKKTWRRFKENYSVEELEYRFDFEEEWLKEGKNIRSREFFKELKKRLGKDNGSN